MSDVIVDWAPGLLSAGWRIDKRRAPDRIPLPWLSYLQAPRHLRSWRAVSRFRRLATSDRFRDWWLKECGGDDPALKRFLLRFPVGVWDVPWELLIGELDRERRMRISIVRGLPGDPTTLPSRFDRPMSVLVIKGDDGSLTGRARLELEREVALLLEAYDSLPTAHKRIMFRPQVCQPTLAEFPGLLAQAPDVLWLSGHGSDNPPAFILADGSPLTPHGIGLAIASASAPPAFAAFWACDTGRVPKDNREAPSPPFYEALLRNGVASVLVMQAPVTDNGAILMAQEVLQALAAGDALDAAAVRARTVLLDAAETGKVDALDWACPVVWSSGLPAARLTWDSPEPQLAQLQAASRRARLNREGRAFFPPTPDELELARRWAAAPPCWVKGGDLAAHRERWIRVLIAMQVVVPGLPGVST